MAVANLNVSQLDPADVDAIIAIATRKTGETPEVVRQIFTVSAALTEAAEEQLRIARERLRKLQG